MSETHVKAVYDAVAEDYADHFPSTEPEQQIELAMIEHFACLLSGEQRKVLDAGCGAGRMFPVLTKAGCSVIGTDISEGMIRRARRDHPDFDTRLGSIAALPFPDQSFDGLFYWYSVIHTPDASLAAVFAETRRVLRSHGHVLVAFQVGRGVQEVGEGYRRLGHDVEIERHDRTPDDVAQKLLAAGMTEVARLVRDPADAERSGQAVLIARAAG